MFGISNTAQHLKEFQTGMKHYEDEGLWVKKAEEVDKNYSNFVANMDTSARFYHFVTVKK